MESNTSSGEPTSDPSELRVEEKLSRVEFLCAAIAFTIGSGNVWLLPSSITKGGLAFIIQFGVCYLLAATPLLYMEIALGQFTSASPWCIYQMLSSAMSGVPAAIGFNLILRCIATSVWVTEFLSMSAISLEGSVGGLDYSSCRGDYCYDHRLVPKCMFASPNTTLCGQFLLASVNSRGDYQKSTPLMYFFETFLGELDMVDKTAMGFLPNAILILALLLTWSLAGFAATAGIAFLGKFAYLVILVAVMATIIMLCLAITVGAFESLRHYMELHYNLLWSVESWISAAGQALITLNVSTGGMIKLASARSFHVPIVLDVVIIAVAALLYNAITLTALVALMESYAEQLYPYDDPEQRFHFVAVRKYTPIMLVVEAIVGIPFDWVVAAFHFFALAIVPLQVLMTDLWVVMSMLHEKYVDSFRKPLQKMQLAVFLIVMSIVGFVASFPFIMPGGFTQLHLVHKISKDVTLILGFLQLLTVAYIYGFRRFSVNIRTMVGGHGPVNFFWWFNWVVTSPFLQLACFVASFTVLKEKQVGGVAWRVIFAIMTFIWIPINFLFKNYERKKICEPIQIMFRPRKDWGPADAADREEAKQMERALRVL